MTNLKLAFIGYGKHARANLYPSIKLLGYKISAVATLHKETSELAAKEYEISENYTSHLELFEKSKPDAVFISVKPSEQFTVAKDALKAGINVFSEKPLGMTVAEAQEIVKITKETGKRVMVGFMKRHSPVYCKIKDFLTEDKIGKPLGITQLFTSRNFAQNAKEYLFFAAIHYIDLMRWYLGKESSVVGFETTNQDSSTISFSIKFENGTVGSLQYCGSPAWERGNHEMTITGTDGYIKASGVDRLVLYQKNKEITVPRWQVLEENEQTFGTMLTTGIGGIQPLYLNGFVSEIKHFVESIENSVAPMPNAEENLNTTILVDKMINSLK